MRSLMNFAVFWLIAGIMAFGVPKNLDLQESSDAPQFLKTTDNWSAHVHTYLPPNLLVAIDDGMLRVWNLESRSLVIDATKFIVGVSSPDYIVASRNTQRFGFGDTEGKFVVYDVGVWDKPRVFEGIVRAMNFSNDGNALIVRTPQKTIRVLDIATRSVKFETTPFPDSAYVSAALIHPETGILHVLPHHLTWNVEHKRWEKGEYPPFQPFAGLNQFIWDPTSDLTIQFRRDSLGWLEVVSPSKGSSYTIDLKSREIDALAVSADSQLVAVAFSDVETPPGAGLHNMFWNTDVGNIEVYSLSSARRLATIPGPPLPNTSQPDPPRRTTGIGGSLCFLNNGDLVSLDGEQRGRERVSILTLRSAPDWRIKKSVIVMEGKSRNPKSLATALEAPRLLVTDKESRLDIYDSRTLTLVWSVPIEQTGLDSFAMSPDGELVAMVGEGDKLWVVGQGEGAFWKSYPLPPDLGYPFKVRFLPTGKSVVIGFCRISPGFVSVTPDSEWQLDFESQKWTKFGPIPVEDPLLEPYVVLPDGRIVCYRIAPEAQLECRQGFWGDLVWRVCVGAHKLTGFSLLAGKEVSISYWDETQIRRFEISSGKEIFIKRP